MSTRIVATDFGICIKNKQNEYKQRTLQIHWLNKIIFIGKKGQIQNAYPFSEVLGRVPSEGKYNLIINLKFEM